jgi:hypothetical protein
VGLILVPRRVVIGRRTTDGEVVALVGLRVCHFPLAGLSFVAFAPARPWRFKSSEAVHRICAESSRL